jgi:ABC-type glycerol-3-phosphate transport system substrate-binding protein
MARTFARRQFLQALGRGATALIVAACAGGSPAGPAPGSGATPKPAEKAAAPVGQPAAPAAEKAAPAAPAAKASGSGVFWFNQPPQQEAFQKIIEKFHQSQDWVKLEVVLVPGADLPAKLATAIAGGEPPDAVRLGGPAVNSLFINNGQAAALDDWDSKIGTYDWLPPIKKAVTKDGKMRAMPVNSGVQGFIYNTELYQKAGLDPAKPPTTFDQLMENAAKIGASGDQVWGHYVLTAPNSQTGSDYLPAALWAFGARDVSEDGTKIAFNSPEAATALQWYKDLIAKKGTPVKKIDEVQMLNDYLTGSVGSMVVYPAVVARVAGANFKSASARYPTGPKGQQTQLGFGTIMVLDKAKNRDAGWEFAKFIGLEAANGAFWNISFGQLPPRLSFRDDPGWKDYEAKNPLVPPYVDAQKSADLPYYGPGSQEIGTELGKAVEAVVFGQKTPQQALEEAAKASQTILDRERQKAG